MFVPVSFTALFTALSVFPVRSDGRKSARGRSDNSVLIKLFACKIISLSHPSHHHDLTLSGDKPPFGLSTLSRCPPTPPPHPSFRTQQQLALSIYPLPPFFAVCTSPHPHFFATTLPFYHPLFTVLAWGLSRGRGVVAEGRRH